MAERDDIYRATVTAVEGDYLTVTLIDDVKCDGCALSSACGSRPSKREVKVPYPPEGNLKPGDEIKVKCPPSATNHAMLWGIIYPCILIVAASVLLNFAGLDDKIVAISGLGAVAVYYVILFAMRRRLNRRLEWRVVE